ncbi:hypothetical protein JSY14_06020 [Brachybacterium sp. EF45031]|uniref:hypothetical protein n=1 Tax=Brachybacterium sillae TaxID=2810536 RepID=UPI00217E0614|nr:hypothetical protein [Brachybacterium sillae]MCS6711603.1 hypothetical protein [Brachybacterium sillae]
MLTAVDGGRWVFRYTRTACEGGHTHELPGLPLTEEPVIRSYLFPIFAERIISPRRPDRVQYLHALDLPPDAGAFEILSATNGHRHGDTIELLRLPEQRGDGTVSAQFLVHGVRHRSEEEQAAIDALAANDRLQLRPEPDNVADRHAQLVVSLQDVALGWVPAPLAPFIGSWSEVAARVVHVNAAGGDPHLRLLVEVTGRAVQPDVLTMPEWDIPSLRV